MLPGDPQEVPQRYSLALSVEGPKRAEPKDNQDASKSWCDEELGIHVVAVADGHGSASHNRSDIGSKLAVQCVTDLIQQFVRSDPSVVVDGNRFDEFKAWWTGALFSSFHAEWKSKVSLHIASLRQNNEPHFSTRESAVASAMTNLRIQYGTTLLVALSRGNLVALGQVGDGLTIAAGKQVTFPLIQPDEDLDDTRNETDSLCNDNPRAIFKAFKGQKPPRLVFLCSDGIDDGFNSIAAVKKWIADLSRSGEILEPRVFQTFLEGRIEEISKTSGDDATVGLIFSPDGDLPELEVAVIADGSEATSIEDASVTPSSSALDHTNEHGHGPSKNSEEGNNDPAILDRDSLEQTEKHSESEVEKVEATDPESISHIEGAPDPTPDPHGPVGEPSDSHGQELDQSSVPQPRDQSSSPQPPDQSSSPQPPDPRRP